MKKLILLAMVAMLAVACNSDKNKAQAEFDKIVEQALNIEISNDKVVATFDQNANRTYFYQFLYNDYRQDVIELWHRQTQGHTYYKDETIGWIVGFKIGGNNTYAYPVKAPRFGVIEKDLYSLSHNTEYKCIEPTFIDDSGVLFVMQTDSVAICNEYLRNRSRLSLEDLERDRRAKQRLINLNKLVRKTTDW